MTRAGHSRQTVQSQYRHLVEQVPAVTYMAERGPSGHWYYISPQVEQLLGFTPAEWLAKPQLWREQMHPDDLERVLGEERGLVEEGDRFRSEYRMHTRSGQTVWLRDEATYVREAETGKLVMRGLMLDITERKQAEEDLHRTEQHLYTTVDAAPVILFAIDPSGVFTLSEGRGLLGLGLKPGQVVGSSVYDLYRDNPQILECVHRSLSGEEFTTFNEVPEYQRTYETRWSQTRDNAGNVLGVIGVATDITERLQAEEALRRSEERYRVFMTQSSDGIARTEYDPPVPIDLPPAEQIALGMKNGHVAECNDAMARMYGFTAAGDMVGKRLSELVFMDNPVNQKFAEEFVGGGYRVSDFETQGKNAQGQVRIFRNTLVGIVENRKLVRTWGVQRDVSERLQLEERLREMQQMEAIGRLAGGIAHDFNNMMGVILGHAEVLSSLAELPERVRKGLLHVQRAAEQAAALTRQLLAFSRKQVLQLQVLDLNEIVADVQKMLSRVIGEHIDLVARLHPSLARIKADRSQMEQVLMNLAINARDAMPGGGVLMMETANVNLDEEFVRLHPGCPAGPCVMLTVSDTGVGIDPVTLDHIFEPFFTTKEAGKGTGMGLATVYGIVTQCHGNILVSSEPGKGATFKIYFPVERETSELQAEGEVTEVVGGTETILLSEDEPNLREITRIFLEHYGYHVLEASDVRQAQRIAQTYEGPIHLTVTDVVMPEMSGRELVERILQKRPDMKVLYMTGYTDDMVIRHKVLEPGVSLLQKPFSREDLARKVRSTLDEA